MRPGLLEDLVCSLCGEPLRLDSAASAAPIETRELFCSGCIRSSPIRPGVPRLAPPDLNEQQRKTASALGWQWRHFAEMHPAFEAQLLDWIHQIEPDVFRGKRVLDAGCGTGRHARLVALRSTGGRRVGPQRRLRARGCNLAHLGNTHVVQGDLLRPPLRRALTGDGRVVAAAD